MRFASWAESVIRRYHWIDIWLIKIATAAFMLMVAKLWPPLLSLDWHWYALVAILAAIRPLRATFGRLEQ